MPDTQDWFAANAPAAGANWFADHAPESAHSALVDVAIGAGKRVMRAGQQIGNIPKVVGLPGLTDLTDRGGPAGASWAASEPINSAQRLGSAGTAAAAAIAAGLATPAGTIGGSGSTFNTATRVTTPIATAVNAGERLAQPGATATKAIGRMSLDALRGAAQELSSGGPVTMSRIGAAVATYGCDAVKFGLKAIGGYELWRAWEATK